MLSIRLALLWALRTLLSWLEEHSSNVTVRATIWATARLPAVRCSASIVCASPAPPGAAAGRAAAGSAVARASTRSPGLAAAMARL